MLGVFFAAFAQAIRAALVRIKSTELRQASIVIAKIIFWIDHLRTREPSFAMFTGRRSSSSTLNFYAAPPDG